MHKYISEVMYVYANEAWSKTATAEYIKKDIDSAPYLFMEVI